MANFETSFKTASIPAAGVYNVIFTTGALGASFTARSVSFSGTAGSAAVYEAPTGVAGGTPAPSSRLNQRITTTALGVMTHGNTISTTGTSVAAVSYYRGSSGVGNSVVGTFVTAAAQRTLKPNTVYLLQFTNSDAAAQVIDLYFAWSE